MTDSSETPQWLTSAEVRRRLKISTCELAHLRNNGQLKFKKQGNAYLYWPDAAAPVQDGESGIELAARRPECDANGP